MTSLSVAHLLELTQAELVRVQRYYEGLHDNPPGDGRSMLADFLSQREANTIETLDRYQARDEDHPALDVYVRLGEGIPFTETLVLPEQPSIEQLIAVAESTDTQLVQLGERVRLYAAAGRLGETLEALDALIRARQHQLTGALRELDEFAYGSVPPVGEANVAPGRATDSRTPNPNAKDQHQP